MQSRNGRTKGNAMLRIDAEADAAYVEFRHAPAARTEQLSDQLIVDYDKSGAVIGVEILDVSEGVDLDGLSPELEMRIGRALEEHNIKVLTH
jgi:uncharacterized protein YuzE